MKKILFIIFSICVALNAIELKKGTEQYTVAETSINEYLSNMILPEGNVELKTELYKNYEGIDIMRVYKLVDNKYKTPSVYIGYTKNLILPYIYSIIDHEDLSGAIMSKSMITDLKELAKNNIDKALHLKAENTKDEVVVVVDPTCPHCEAFLEKIAPSLKDTDYYIFFTTLLTARVGENHRLAIDKNQYKIIANLYHSIEIDGSAVEKAKAFIKALKERNPSENPNDKELIKNLEFIDKSFLTLGVNKVPNFININGKFIN